MRSTRLARRAPAVLAVAVAASALVIGPAASARPTGNSPSTAVALDVRLYVIDPWRTL